MIYCETQIDYFQAFHSELSQLYMAADYLGIIIHCESHLDNIIEQFGLKMIHPKVFVCLATAYEHLNYKERAVRLYRDYIIFDQKKRFSGYNLPQNFPVYSIEGIASSIRSLEEKLRIERNMPSFIKRIIRFASFKHAMPRMKLYLFRKKTGNLDKSKKYHWPKYKSPLKLDLEPLMIPLNLKNE